MVPFSIGVVKERTKGLPFEVFGGVEGGEVAEGGEKIEEFHNPFCLLARSLELRGRNDERDARGDLVVGGLSPHSHVPEVPAVVAPEHHNGILIETGFLEGLQNESNLGIDVGGAGQVGVKERARELLVDRADLGNAVPDAQFKRSVESHRGSVFWRRGVGAGGEFIGIIQVPVFLGSDEVEVGFVKSESEEKRLFGPGKLAEVSGGSGSMISIPVGGVGSLGGFEGRTGRETFLGRFAVLLEHLLELLVPSLDVFGIGKTHGLRETETEEFGPSGERLLEVIATPMEDLSVGVALIAMIAEVAGKSEEFRVEVAERDEVVRDAIAVGSSAGEQRSSRRMADRLLAIGSFEEAAARGQLIDVRGDGILRAIATEFRAQVVDGDEKDVWFCFRRGYRLKSDQQEPGWISCNTQK